MYVINSDLIATKWIHKRSCIHLNSWDDSGVLSFQHYFGHIRLMEGLLGNVLWAAFTGNSWDDSRVLSFQQYFGHIRLVEGLLRNVLCTEASFRFRKNLAFRGFELGHDDLCSNLPQCQKSYFTTVDISGNKISVFWHTESHKPNIDIQICELAQCFFEAWYKMTCRSSKDLDQPSVFAGRSMGPNQRPK